MFSKEFEVSEYDRALRGLYSDTHIKHDSYDKRKAAFDIGVLELTSSLIGGRVQIVANPLVQKKKSGKTAIALGNQPWAERAMNGSDTEGLSLDEIVERSESMPGLEDPFETGSRGKRVKEITGILFKVALLGNEVRARVFVPDDGIRVGNHGDHAVATLISPFGTDKPLATAVCASIREI